jgi:cytochrome c5
MLRTLSTCLTSIALAATMVASVLKAQDTDTLVSICDGVYTPPQADRGKATFDVSCSRCHNAEPASG